MKIHVLCDRQGNIQSVAIPNPELADRINVQADDGGRVHKLDVDSSVLNPEALRDAADDEYRKRVYDKLRGMIRERGTQPRS